MEILTRTPEEWARELEAFGPRANVLRAIRAVYRGEAAETWRLPALGARLSAALERHGVSLALPGVVSETTSDDGAEKLLLALPEGRVEAVLIPGVRRESSKLTMRRKSPQAPRRAERSGGRPQRAAGCISTQIGCAVGCGFCASGLQGLARNLEAGAIVAQALVLRERARARGALLATLVFMGMGEPLHNTENVLRALEALTDRWGAGFGPSTITVSTVGVIPGIERLAALGKRAPNLALSLHAPDDATRARIIPMKGLATASEALAAARAFARASGRFVTVSYVLLAGVNDEPAQADELARMLSGTGFHVNLIPWNAVPGLSFAPSPRERAQDFWTRLRGRGISCHFRKARGAEADAACGQLRRRAPADA